MYKVFVIAAIIVLVNAKAIPDEIDAGPPPLFSFSKGGVGVNFGGYHASAGLGGLLSGDSADGGLHAEAGTPHGQAARAGLGGVVDGNGGTAGNLYAGATAGGGVSAAAGLGGAVDGSGATGAKFAGASYGGHESHVVNYAKSKTVTKVAPATYHKTVEVAAAAKPLAEEAVAPKYVEKTIYEPSYVEKTIRVPTVVAKTVKVPAPPAVVEKDVAPVLVEGVKFKHHYHPRRNYYFHKRLGFYGGANGAADASTYGNAGGYGTVTVRKTANPQLVKDIFNIPISTLNAVSQLVGGIASGTSGSVSVHKSYGASLQ